MLLAVRRSSWRCWVRDDAGFTVTHLGLFSSVTALASLLVTSVAEEGPQPAGPLHGSILTGTKGTGAPPLLAA